MSRDAVTEINTENPVAKEAFIHWWRTMEAQGYQYGFEALCNVWVGFDDGRSDLAAKVLETVEAVPQSSTDLQAYSEGYEHGKEDVINALRDLFQREGIEVNSSSN